MKLHHTFNLVMLLIFSMTTVQAGESRTCMPNYQGKPFFQVIIWELGSRHDGPAECQYKNKEETQTMVYPFPKNENFKIVSGLWRMEIPGTQLCSVNDGNTVASCQFALKE